jgi:uncharacterized membrane protein YhaH (DUF805 family)
MTINTYLKYLILGFKNYFKFKGRTTREEFWCFYSFVFIVSNISLLFFPWFVFGICILIFFIPTTAVYCRRLHDMNKSGWIQCFFFIPTAIVSFFKKELLLFSFALNTAIFIFWIYYLSQKGFNGKTKYDE